MTVLDHAPTEEIRKKYAELGLDAARLAQIEDVDCVWSGGKYTETPGLKPPYDFVIASHVIEHTRSPIAFVSETQDMLSENGCIALVVPDKRFCFDHDRPLSSAGAILDAHLCPTPFHAPGVVFDHFAYHVGFGGEFVWSSEKSGSFYRDYTTERAAAEAKQAIETAQYMDVHRWVFTPSSLLFIVAILSQSGWLDMKVIGHEPTVGCEFFVTLGHGRDEHTEEETSALLHQIVVEETMTNVDQLASGV